MATPDAGTTSNKPSKGHVIVYRYKDTEGVEHIVDNFEAIPEVLRASAQPVDLGPPAPAEPPPRGGDELERLTREAKKGIGKLERGLGKQLEGVKPAVIEGVHAPSAVLGFGAGLALWAVVALLRSRLGALVKVLLFVGLALAIGAAYLGVVRSAAGLGPFGLATPSQLLEEARRAERAASERARQKEALMDTDPGHEPPAPRGDSKRP